MRLGIVGMLPGDLRSFTDGHFERIRELGFTGAGFHLPGELLNDISDEDAAGCRRLFADHQIDLAQFAITYGECLFDPDPEVRSCAVSRVVTGAKIAARLGAGCYLIRPGSRNPAGAWTPHRENHTPEAYALLNRTLRQIARRTAALNVVTVMESHVVSILNTPQACRRLIESVNSANMRLVMDYVNHFESIDQVYSDTDRLNHIFETIGALAPVCHVKDIAVGNRLVVHLEEAVPGHGELNLALALGLFHARHPDGYALIEHLGPDQIPLAAANVRAISKRAGVPIY
ncbi:MAG: sugar phosphate isomerase/epimerase [Gemmatimonadota bacterium]|nr:sugar phosphate isomerase/epimerase [Gemmatimonadota bacterium]